MALNPQSDYPSTGAYVLRLHRDARPQDALLIGRIEHLTSGDSLDFACSQDLLDWLVRHAVGGLPPAGDGASPAAWPPS